MSTIANNEFLDNRTNIGSSAIAPDELIAQIAHGELNVPHVLICQAELMQFSDGQRRAILPLLWKYVLDHRDSNDRDDLIATGAAIRKYIAMMPMEELGQLAVLLESGHRAPLSLELELEVAKMIYRNFEVHPPININPQPDLADKLWEMAQVYVNPRILLRDKHSAVASLSIESLVAMRSTHAEEAWRTAMNCPYRWFAELVSDDLDELRRCSHWVARRTTVTFG